MSNEEVQIVYQWDTFRTYNVNSITTEIYLSNQYGLPVSVFPECFRKCGNENPKSYILFHNELLTLSKISNEYLSLLEHNLSQDFL